MSGLKTNYENIMLEISARVHPPDRTIPCRVHPPDRTIPCRVHPPDRTIPCRCIECSMLKIFKGSIFGRKGNGPKKYAFKQNGPLKDIFFLRAVQITNVLGVPDGK